jgi:hypothetical protein
MWSMAFPVADQTKTPASKMTSAAFIAMLRSTLRRGGKPDEGSLFMPPVSAFPA